MQQIRNISENKKTSQSDSLLICNNHMVLQVGKSFHEIRGEIERWREVLAVPYQEYLLSR